MLQIHLVMIVPFRNRFRGNNLRPVNRIKHVIDKQAGVVLGVQNNTDIITSTDTPTLANTDGVETGSKVHAFYLKVECYATTAAALSNVYLICFKNPGGNLATPAANTVGANDNKKYVFHQEMVMLQQAVNGNPRTLFNGVIRIPKLYQRNGPNDITRISILAPGVNFNLCVQCHYKEFR